MLRMMAKPNSVVSEPTFQSHAKSKSKQTFAKVINMFRYRWNTRVKRFQIDVGQVHLWADKIDFEIFNNHIMYKFWRWDMYTFQYDYVGCAFLSIKELEK